MRVEHRASPTMKCKTQNGGDENEGREEVQKNLKHHSGHKGIELRNPNRFQQRSQPLGQNFIRNKGIPKTFL